MSRLEDQYKSTIHELVQRVLKLEKWKRDSTGDSPLFDIANEHTPDSLGGDQDDYDPGFYDVLRINAMLDISITGISRGQKGRFLELANISVFTITLPYESTSSSAANRIINSSGQDIRIFPTGRVRLYYDSTLARWVVPDPPSWKGAYGTSVRLYITSTPPDEASSQEITNGVPTNILLDTIDPTIGDPYGFFDSANNRIVIPAGMGGLYVGKLSGTWTGYDAGTLRYLSYSSSAIFFPGYPGASPPAVSVPSIDGTSISMICPIAILCAPGDIITFTALQISDIPLTLSSIDVHFGRLTG